VTSAKEVAVTAFRGRIGRDWRDSEPWWPDEPRARDGAPNVVLVVLDDVGFAQLGCYGSDIETPVIDALAARGVRLARFYTTGLCSPTRACLLTGRNHHRNAMGRVADLAVGFPGYWGAPPRENGFLPEVLRQAGYATYCVGKWHLTPEDATNAAGSRDTWPLSRGFDRWYGFHGGETHQFVPALFEDSHARRPPREASDYHLSEDLADRGIEYVGDLRAVDPSRPFFLYLATGACHSPHQPPERWRAHYAGRFDQGWDAWRDATFARQVALGLFAKGTAMSARPPWVRPWSDLDERERRVAARFMECYAGFLSHADEQVGRVLAFVDEIGELDNTLVAVVSDNGASAEGGSEGSINDVRLTNLDPASTEEMDRRLDEIGGPSTHNNYPWGWTMAGNTPFRRWKREVHQGGVCDPCVIAFARGGLAGGAIRHQFAHAIDLMPTILDLVGLEAPATIGDTAQSPLDGVSLKEVLGPDGAGAPERHATQYFEMFGSRALYHQGMKAVTFHPVGPLYDDQDPNAPFDEDHWELYDVRADPAETRDLSGERPELVAEMERRWWVEAERNQVLPLDNRVLWALVHPRPDRRAPRDRYRYFPGGAPVPEAVAVNVRNRSHALEVDLVVGPGRTDGVLVALGTALGGWSLHVLDGRPRYVHNLYGKERHVVASPTALGAGPHRIVYRFDKDDGPGGTGTLSVDDEVVADAAIARFTPSGFGGTGVGVTCGYEWGPPVGEGYAAPFAFSGTIARCEVVTLGPVVRDPLAELEAILAEQ
jgi:arylsulfatase A-like enzyme